MNKFNFEQVYIPEKFKRTLTFDGDYESPIALEVRKIIREMDSIKDGIFCDVITECIDVKIDKEALLGLIKGEQEQFYELKKRIELLEKALDIAYRSIVYYQKQLYPQLEWNDENAKKWKEWCLEQAQEMLDNE